MKTRRMTTTLVLLALMVFLLATLAVVYSQRREQQARPVEAQQLTVLQLAQKPRVHVETAFDVPTPPGNVNTSMKARRDYAWEIVKLVWRPVTVDGGKVPLWITWYEQEDIEGMYNEMLSQRSKPK